MNSPQNPQDSSTPPPLPPPPPPNRRTKQPGTAAAWAISSPLTFPYTLHDMLAAAEHENFTHIVSWQPNGNSFKIHKKEEFVSRILPRYFNATKYQSFYLQLNMWGFKSCHNIYTFSHQHFVREKPELCKHMSRKKETKKSDTKTTFPYRLHGLLAAAECDEQSTSIVSWLPEGRSFRIHDVPKFESSILPRFFNITKYDSFYSQLKKWGFKPCREEGRNTFFNEYFVRHNPEQCSILSCRQDTKKAGTNFTYSTSPSATNDITKKRKGDAAVFPRRLHQLLESAEIETFTSIISWLPDGKSFKVHNKEQFVSSILSRFFPSQHCYESFYIQLNTWGFRGCPEKGSFTFSHKYFVRGKPELCDIMTRKQQRASPSKGTTTTNSNNNENGCSDQFFPNRLHRMLRAAEIEQFTSIISWLPDGKSFQIHNKEKFVSSILPRFFPTLHHYVSFYVKLNSFGFKSWSKKRNFTYSHEHFVRDNLELWNLMAKRQTTTGSKNSTTERADRFPSILHKMLETAETEDFVSVVSWLPDGRSFKVHNKNEFVSSVMPRFFNTMANFKSFYDQLNTHGFQCPRMHTYLHQHFIRDDPKSCHLISRMTPLKRKSKTITCNNNNINNNGDYFSTMNTDKARQPTMVGSTAASAKMSTTTCDESIDDANTETRSRGAESPPFDGHHASAGRKRPPLQNTSYAGASATSTETANKQEVIDISSDEDEDHKINPDDYESNNCYTNEQLIEEDQEGGDAMNISRMAGGSPSSHNESSAVAHSQQQQEIAMDGTAASIGGDNNEEEPDCDQIAMDACMRGFQASYLMGKNSNYESPF